MAELPILVDISTGTFDSAQMSGPCEWNVLLRCPDCEVHRQGAFRQRTVDALDPALVRGTDALRRDYKQLVAANMADETERFVSALHADAILPEDF